MEIIYILLIFYFLLFLISIKIKDNSIVDIFWGLGFLIISSYLIIDFGNYNIYNILVLLILFIWGIRLSYHILKRKIRLKKEDPRYAKWRKKWKYFYIRSFFQVYILQMILMLLVSTPIFYIFSEGNINVIYFIIGIILSIIGLVIEVISDNQLREYLSKNKEKNKIFTGGLYKYSRNPNYFGESLFWLGISIIGSNISIFSFIGFITISFLLLFVSGIPIKEKRQINKDNWLEYKRKTSVFFPWFPKK